MELISPVLDSDDLGLFFSILSVLRELGASVNSTCSVHIHIDAPSVGDCVNLYNKYCRCQDKLYKTFGVSDIRLSRYCRKYDSNILMPDLQSYSDIIDWLRVHYLSNGDYDRTLRYYSLVEQYNTLEFRLFRGSLEHDVVSGYIDFVKDFIEETKHD